MSMDEKTIKEVLREGERVTLECKRAKAEVPKSVLTSAIRHQNRDLSFNSLLITVPPYESIRKYTIFLRHPNRHFPNTKMPCLSGFQKIGILRNVKTAEVRKLDTLFLS